jgi:hypothetical protein
MAVVGGGWCLDTVIWYEALDPAHTHCCRRDHIWRVRRRRRRGARVHRLRERPGAAARALSADQKTLFAVNTPDNRLEIFKVTSEGLEHKDSVPVGLEPVAVAVRSNSEVWVVNHLSDSVSVVSLSGEHPDGDADAAGRRRAAGHRVRGGRTSRGPSSRRRTAVRTPRSPRRTRRPGWGRADVWVFNTERTWGAAWGGTPMTIVNLFSDTPRALAATADGKQGVRGVVQLGQQDRRRRARPDPRHRRGRRRHPAAQRQPRRRSPSPT